MLGEDFTRAYQKLYDGFVPLAVSNTLPYRLEEVNNYFSGGATNGFYVRPLGCGIAAFSMGSHGRLVPVTLNNPEQLNLNAYAVIAEDQGVCLTIINKEHGPTGRDAAITLGHASAKSFREQLLPLTAPNHDVAATIGETLGGAGIQNDGQWPGRWRAGNESVVEVPAGGAVVLRLRVPQ